MQKLTVFVVRFARFLFNPISQSAAWWVYVLCHNTQQMHMMNPLHA
jgi:hypothetical protein